MAAAGRKLLRLVRSSNWPIWAGFKHRIGAEYASPAQVSHPSASGVPIWSTQQEFWGAVRAFASQGGDSLTRKEIIYKLGDRDDPEVDATIKAYLREQYNSAGRGGVQTPAVSQDDLNFTAKVERKYAAAQIVENGIQDIHLPLAPDAEKGNTPIKRFVSQILRVGEQAGFQDPSTEVETRLQESAALADTVKDFLNRVQPFMSASFHSDLTEALGAIENETGAPLTFDKSSAGYKKFADKVKAIAQKNKLPWQMLLSYKEKIGSVDEETENRLRKDYDAWVQSAQLQDAVAELEALRAEATRVLDLHLTKSVETVRKEQEAARAANMRKVEAAKSTEWAQRYLDDLKYLSWFDSKVSQDPLNGPAPAS